MFNLAGGDVTKPYCKNTLQARADESLDRPLWLLLTCNDVVMKRVMERILNIEPMVVVCQSEVACSNDLVLSAAERSSIDHTVNDRAMQQFMAVGTPLVLKFRWRQELRGLI
jgi:hypothetical protein